jgi:hypothetical protein
MKVREAAVKSVRKMALAASLIFSIFSASSALATSCGSVSVSERALKASHIVASGRIVVLSEEIEYPSSVSVLVKGTAELHVESITRNRTKLIAPFRLTFQYLFDGACTIGAHVHDGQFAIVYLKRPSPQARLLTVIKIE